MVSTVFDQQLRLTNDMIYVKASVNCPYPVPKTCTHVRQRVAKDMTCADELVRA